MDAFPGGVPTAAALDAIVADRPAFFPNRDGHGAWVNTKALQLAGIDDATEQAVTHRQEAGAVGRTAPRMRRIDQGRPAHGRLDRLDEGAGADARHVTGRHQEETA